MSDKADIKELAVATWRLEKWLDNLNADRKMAAKSALRSIKKYITASGVEVKDPLGSKFDPGLAVKVINNESDGVPEDKLIIIETLAPYVYQDGELVQHARVIIGTDMKETKVSNGIIKDATETSKEKSPNTDNAEQTAQKSRSDDDLDDIKIGTDDIERLMAYAKIL